MQNLSLRDFITHREAEIKEQRAVLLKELKELKRAKAAISDGNDSSSKQKSDTESGKSSELKPSIEANWMPRPANDGSSLTIKEMVVEVLRKQREPATSDTIRSWIESTFSKSIARESLSPQLSRLRQSKVLSYSSESGEWALTPKMPGMPGFNDGPKQDDDAGIFAKDRKPT